MEVTSHFETKAKLAAEEALNPDLFSCSQEILRRKFILYEENFIYFLAAIVALYNFGWSVVGPSVCQTMINQIHCIMNR